MLQMYRLFLLGIYPFIGYDLNQLHCIFSELTLTYLSKISGSDREMGRDGETGRKKCYGYLS